MPSVQEDGELTPQERSKIIEEERLRYAVRMDEMASGYASFGNWVFKSAMQLLAALAVLLLIVLLIAWWRDRGNDRELRNEPVSQAPSATAPAR